MFDHFDDEDEDDIEEPCALCERLIGAEEPIMVFEPFAADADLQRYFDEPMHWDCYARWKDRRRMARQWFNACVESVKDNPYWGIARLDEHVQVSVNPSRGRTIRRRRQW